MHVCVLLSCKGILSVEENWHIVLWSSTVMVCIYFPSILPLSIVLEGDSAQV